MANEDVTCLETLEIRNCSISSDARMNQALTGILQEPPELLETFDVRYGPYRMSHTVHHKNIILCFIDKIQY